MLPKYGSQGRLPSAKKMSQTWKPNEFDDIEYLSLKELSRTNFNDLKYNDSGLCKRRGIKSYKNQKRATQQNLNKKKNIIVKKEKQFNLNSNKALNFIQGMKALDLNSIRA